VRLRSNCSSPLAQALATFLEGNEVACQGLWSNAESARYLATLVEQEPAQSLGELLQVHVAVTLVHASGLDQGVMPVILEVRLP
jgi:hypothetical protein